LLFHVWPGLAPGGYVGVDAFFVISGYLITGSLFRMALEHGGISLPEFYNRRIRRLLPAATLVLLLTAIGTFLLLPASRWQEVVAQVVASAFYVENWALAAQSVDYLAAGNVPTPVQHYWSLSVEEQFYLFWPLLMIGGAALAKARGISVRGMFVALLGMVFVTSLATSIYLTTVSPAWGFFVTHTRMWELALGGLLALTRDRLQVPQPLRFGMFAAGVSAIAAAGLFFTAHTPYPGYAALLPTLGALLVIWAGDVQLGYFRGLNAGWLRWVGDRSYSIYLVHWPLVIFYTAHQTIGIIDGVGLIAASLIASHLLYTYMEERFRRPRAPIEWRPAAFAAGSLACFAIALVGSNYWIGTAGQRFEPGDPDHPGPLALVAGARVPQNVAPIPSLVQLKADLPVVYSMGCHQTPTGAEVLSCQLGDPEGTQTIALVGDSHAASWVPALEAIALRQHWKLVTYTKSSCAYGQNGGDPSCAVWQSAVDFELLKTKPAIAFFGRYNNGGDRVVDAIARNVESSWGDLIKAGIEVVAIKDTPDMNIDPGECIAEGGTTCEAPRASVFYKDPYVVGAIATPGVKLVDLSDALCGPEQCDVVVGNVIAWRDSHHMTASYAAALAPILAAEIGVSLASNDPALVTSKTVRIALSCSALSPANPEFNRVYTGAIRDGQFVLLRGKAGASGYEQWSGELGSNGAITITGTYIEGDVDEVKQLSLAGTGDGQTYKVQGARGPRNCTAELQVGS
jgi:peptidoglycan/LPS O-acetylase OafA/YrhL